MSHVRLVCFALVLLAGCGKSDPDKAKAEDGVAVGDYCEKFVTLSDEVAAENMKHSKKKEPEPGEPSRDDQVTFCKMMFGNAKNEEPQAYACMAECMMDADSLEDERKCTKKKKCLAKAKNKKLFSNQVGE